MDDKEKAELGAVTLAGFFEQFGEDVYAKILLEVLLEGIINEETVFVFGEQEQKGLETGSGTEWAGNDPIQSDRVRESETPTGMGETSPEGYL